MERVLCAFAAFGFSLIGPAAVADDKQAPAVCKPGTSTTVTGGLTSLPTEDGQIGVSAAPGGKCKVNSIDVKGKVPPGCKEGVRISASGKIRHEHDKEEDETYYVLDDVKDLKCEDVDKLLPSGCKVGDALTATGIVGSTSVHPTNGISTVYLKPGKSQGPCPLKFMSLKLANPASCGKDSSITATGRVAAELDSEGAIDVGLIKLETFKCSGGEGAKAAANAEKDCVEASDVAQRIAACSELLGKDANNWSTFKSRGDGYSRTCAAHLVAPCDLAVADYTKALELAPSPTRSDIYMSRGLVFLTAQKYDLAAADYAKLIELEPTNRNAYDQHGRASIKTGDYKSAVADYSKLIALEPGEPANYGTRGWVYMQIEDYKAAIDDYAKAAALNPRDKASAAVLKRLKSLPPNPDAATECAADLGRAQTLKACNEVIAKDPNLASAYFHRAKAYDADKSDEHQMALDDFRKAIELDPKQADFYLERGYIVAGMDGYVEVAIQDFDKAIALDPTRPDGYYARARVYKANKDYARVIADMTKAIELDPKNDEYLCDRSIAYFATGDKARSNADEKAADEISGEEYHCY